MFDLNKIAAYQCIICSAKSKYATCSDKCHEEFVTDCIQKYGMFKKITDCTTQISYKIPVRVILEEGVNQEDLVNYPVWE